MGKPDRGTDQVLRVGTARGVGFEPARTQLVERAGEADQRHVTNMAAATTAVIYGLRAASVHPEIRYIGVTKRQLSERLRGHLYKARRGEATHKGAWIRKVLSQGGTVEIVAIERIPIEQWEARERFWIGAIPNLTNTAAGGQGVLNPTPEHRLKLSIAHRGQTPTLQQREKLRQRLLGNKNSLGHKQTAEHIAKCIAGRRGKVGVYKRTPEQCAAIRARMVGTHYKLGKTIDADGRRRMSEAQRARGPTRAPHSAETRRKMSESLKGRRLSKEHRRKLSEAKHRFFAKRKLTINAPSVA